MAGTEVAVKIYNKQGTSIAYQTIGMSSTPISSILSEVSSLGITAVSDSIGGAAIPGGTTLGDIPTYVTFEPLNLYDVTLEPTYKLHGHIGTWHMEWVPEVDDYSAMQGPCPDGFHVPLKSEWTAIINTGKTLGAWTTSYGGNDFKAKMKTPYAGMRAKASGNISYNGTLAVFWVSDRTAGQVIMPSGVMPGFSDKTSEGFSLRPFKDKPAIPDNSRTTIYSGTGSAGIFHNATLGLISISSDGTNWITIADKNLGATTVYNDGDTLTADNCGYFYQWGNNYGFPYSGSVTTSSIQVDASNYGPGNYYSSSTFIIEQSDRSSVQNDNLWGGATGIITTPGHYRPRQPVVLKTYEEIVAMATAEGRPWTNTIAELNTNVEGYFNILNEGNHLSIGTPMVPEQSGYYINGITSSGYYIRKDISGPLDHNGLWYYEIEE